MTDTRTPGQLISTLLVRKGWSQRTLARILDVGESRLTRVITDKQPVDAHFALLLQDVFGAPAEQFLALQANCELAHARRTRTLSPKLTERLRLYGDLPISDMIKRGWLDAGAIHDTQAVETSLLNLFGVDCADHIDDVLGEVRSDDEAKKNLVHLAWLCRLGQLAGKPDCNRAYSRQALEEALPALRTKMRSRDGVGAVPSILRDCGVQFALIEPLKGGELDGGCIWLNGQRPAIGLSLRHDRLDHFWLVLRHQIEYILHEDGTHARLVLDFDRHLESPGGSVSAQERFAIEAAQEFCASSHQIDEFLQMTGAYVTERDIVQGAARLGVHPGILVATISRRIGKQHSFRRHALKVRAQLAENAMVDGWGGRKGDGGRDIGVGGQTAANTLNCPFTGAAEPA